jgi:photosystem II stability/assembly factor-like uncharacterized protein
VYALRDVYKGPRVFKSIDGGASWVSASTDLPDGVEYALLIDLDRSDTVIVGGGNGVYRSTDGGTSWQQTGLGEPDVAALAGGRQGDTLAVYAVTDSGIYKSADGGRSWKLTGHKGLPDTGSSDGALVVEQDEPTVVYAGFRAGLFNTDDGGGSWRWLNNGMPQIAISDVGVDSADSRTLYASGEGGFFRSEDAGQTWAVASWGSHDAGGVWVAPGGGRVYTEGYYSVFSSSDGGRTWHDRGDVTGIDSDFHSLVGIDPRNANVLYYEQGGHNDQPSELYKSVNGGKTWNRLAEVDLSGLAIDPSNTRRLYAVLLDGIGVSTNGGRAWKRVLGERHSLIFFRAVSIDPRDNTTIYAVSDTAVYKSKDRGRSWLRIWRHRRINGIAIDPERPKRLYASLDNGVYRSSDGGRRWMQLNAGLTIPQCSYRCFRAAFAFARDRPTPVYLATGDGLFRLSPR